MSKHQEKAIRNKMSEAEKSDNKDDDAVAGKHKQTAMKKCSKCGK